MQETESMITHEITESNRNLFANIRYFFINSDFYEVEDLLKLNGAREDKYLSSLITHVICDNPADNSDSYEAKEVFDLPIVKSDWVKKCLELNAILPAEAFSSDTNRLFSQIKVVNLNFPNDKVKPLMAMINYYGGEIISELANEKCTHVISINFDEQSQQLENNDLKKFKLITPDWFTDCIEQNKLVDEMIYNPKFLITNPENKDIQQNNNSKQRLETPEPQPAVATNHIVFKSQLILNDLVLYDTENNKQQCTPSPTSIKLVNKSDAASSINRIIIQQQHQQQHQSNELIDSSNDLSKSLSASSIQAQLENTIRLNSKLTNLESNTNQQQMPILIQQLPMMPNIVQTLVPILPTTATNDNNSATNTSSSLNTTPPSASKQTKLKRPRKQSSETNVSQQISVLSNNSAPPPNQSSTFTSEMDEIFQTVLSNVANDEKKSNEITSVISAAAPSSTMTTADNNKEPPAVKPIYLNLLRSNSFQFDEDSNNNNNNQETNNYLVQENSHLIQFERCLLGCIFYIKSSESVYTAECLLDWHNVIERYGGRTVDDYDAFSNEITHVLVPNRFSSIYKKAFNEKKRLVTAYWLEDVLQEQKLRPPWLAYHFPSPYEIKTGPLTNYIISINGFVGKEKLIIKTLIWLLNGKYSSYISNITSLVISKSDEDESKYEKAKKWNINIVNGVWLMELYLGNTLALNKQIEDRYTNLHVNHFSFDNQFTLEYMDAWKALIRLPIEKIKEASNYNAPLKQLNRSPLKRRNCSRSSSPTNKKDCNSISWIKAQSNVPVVMFTGFNPDDLSVYQKDVISLNGILAKQFVQTTHLIVDKIERTAKLLKCISNCEHIVHIKWLIDSKLEGKFKNPADYQVKDEQFEAHYSCCLKESLDRARERKPLFSGLMFYLSPSVRPSYKDMEEMIKSAGGTVLRDVPKLANFTEPFNDELNPDLKSKYIVIGSQNDICILKPFLEKNIPVYHEEIVLSGLLRQRIEPNKNRFYVEF